jgi:hypothetical protein
VPLCAIARHRARWLTDSGVLCAALVCAAVLISLPVALWIPPHPFFGPVIARGLLSHYVVGGALLLVTLCALRIGAISIPLAEKAAA